MINTEKLELILKKKKDKIPALLEVLTLTGKLCKIDENTFNNAINLALDKVLNLLILEAQSKKTTGYVLTPADYKALGVYERHKKKLRRKSKKSPKKDRLMKIMTKLYEIKQERHLSYEDLRKYAEEKYELYVSRTYFIKIFKKINF